MRDRRAILLDIIEQGVLNARLGAREGDSVASRLETDHIHNLPTLMRTEDERWHDFYWSVERESYINQCKTAAFRSSFLALWSECRRRTWSMVSCNLNALGRAGSYGNSGWQSRL
jgi:hypothetical protein